MSTKPINDGGPAFPHDNQELGGGHRTAQPGMSLRDWFAGQALVGLLHPGYETDSMNAPEHAYRLADAMLAAREAQPPAAADPAPSSPTIPEGFIPWGGGRCPVGERILVTVKTRGGGTMSASARAFSWRHLGRDDDIIAYLVLDGEASR